MIRCILNHLMRYRPYRVEWVEDLPTTVKRRTVYILGATRDPFSASIVCPRKRCRQVIHLDLSPQVRPRWRVTAHPNGTISLAPSVHVTGLPCRCHYWLRRGRIVWCDTPSLLVPRRNKHD